MRNLSIVTQIAIINIFVFTIFISIFIYKNYAIVSNQFVLLQNEKIDSIIKTTKKSKSAIGAKINPILFVIIYIYHVNNKI